MAKASAERDVEADHGRHGRQRGHVAGQALGVFGEQAAAAGGDDVGAQVEEVLELQPQHRRDGGQQHQQRGVLDAHQRVVGGAGVDVVHRQPGGGEEEHRHLRDQRREADRH